MRLLAYGGTGYYERQRIGEWENIPTDALDDSFRLEKDQPTFGLCLVGNAPVLVVRRLQVTGTGRAYAYSLLLDPGETVWRIFGWNMPELATQIFDETHEAYELLMEQPERINSRYLNELVERISPKEQLASNRLSVNSINDFEAAWVGASFLPSISAWPPGTFGFESRPTFMEMATMLSHLPPCFRSGLGWLVGGGEESGGTFGAHVVVDDGTQTKGTPIDLILRGRAILKALGELSSSDEFSDLATELSLRPVWTWVDRNRENANIIAERLIALNTLLDNTPKRETMLQRPIFDLASTPFLEKEFRQAWNQALFSRKKTLTAEQTSDVIANYVDYDSPLGDAELLHDETAVASYIEKCKEGGKYPSDLRIPLSPSQRNGIWIGLLEGSIEAVGVLDVYVKADNDVEGEIEADAFRAKLRESLSRRLMDQGSLSLLPWRDQVDPSDRSLKTLLRNVVLHRLKSRRKDWQFEYLLFADDVGAVELLKTNIDALDIKTLVRLFLNAIDSASPYSKEAREWLNALADSDVRRKGLLSDEDMEKIAHVVGGRWNTYGKLIGAYHGENVTWSGAIESNEKDNLIRDLKRLTVNLPVTGFVPNIHALIQMLGTLPPKLMEYFRNVQLDNSKPNETLAYWEALGDTKRRSKATVDFFLKCDEHPGSDFWLEPTFEPSELNRLFRTLMFIRTPFYEDLYRNRLPELLAIGKERGGNRILQSIKLVFKSGIETDETAAIFCRRFARDRNTLTVLLSCLSAKLSGLSLTDAIARNDAKHFIDEARNIWLTVTRDARALDNYEYAYMYHLYKKKGDSRKVLQLLEEEMYEDIVDLNLDEILNRPGQSGVQSFESTNTTAAVKKAGTGPEDQILPAKKPPGTWFERLITRMGYTIESDSPPSDD